MLSHALFLQIRARLPRELPLQFACHFAPVKSVYLAEWTRILLSRLFELSKYRHVEPSDWYRFLKGDALYA